MAKAKYTYNDKRKEWVTLAWDGTYNADGSKHRKMLTSKKSSKDLEEKVRLLKSSIESNGATVAGNISFYDYALQWVETAKGSKAAQTKEMYLGCIQRHFEGFRSILLQDIRHRHFQQLINSHSDKPRTCQIIELTFKQVIKSAVREHYLPKSALEDMFRSFAKSVCRVFYLFCILLIVSPASLMAERTIIDMPYIRSGMDTDMINPIIIRVEFCIFYNGVLDIEQFFT